MLKRVWAACLAAAFLIPAASAAAPVLTQKDQCASCEMWITKYPGPKGAVQLTDGTVLKYCSARGAACGWTKVLKAGKAKSLWMHDASANDWKKPADDAMVDVKDAWFVYGSKMKAVMGPSLAPFADKAKAEAFQKEHGGKIYRLNELTAEVLGCGAKY